uniref:Uncharacterized protein n=1 Tax=Stegastes partitus TaxID=144197 RepID=A0A3B5ANP5_9TELE
LQAINNIDAPAPVVPDTNTILWMESMHKAFADLKAALVSAPILGLLDYTQLFHLYFSEREGCDSGVLSSKLCTVVRGMSGCLTSVAAVAALIEKSAPLAHDCFAYAPHTVTFLMYLPYNTCQHIRL